MRAAISLLADPDSVVVRACRKKLLEWGPLARPYLRRAAEDGDPCLRIRARAVLKSMDLQDWVRCVREFALTIPCSGQMTWTDLEDGVFLFSNLGPPDLVERERLTKTLDGYAAELRPRVQGKSATTCARLLAGYLAGQLGYGGSRSSFYEEENIHFDKLLKTKLGVPVTLSLLYILVGRRMGLHLTGVAIPDHFLVRVHGTRPVLLDPYHEGRTVTKADCIRYLRIAGYSLHTSSYLEDVHDSQILDCLLRNLLRVYGYREDHEFCIHLEKARQALMQA